MGQVELTLFDPITNVQKKRGCVIPRPDPIVPCLCSNTSSYSAREDFNMKKILIGLLISVTLVGCMGYVPGEQSYWDAQVREMCEKDGGVTVYEIVELSEAEYRNLGGVKGGLPLPHASNKGSDHPYFYEMFDTNIRESNPAVVRTEMLVKRRADKKLLGRSIRYVRRGGDLPTGIVADSSFGCPENTQLTSRIFRVKGGAK